MVAFNLENPEIDPSTLISQLVGENNALASVRSGFGIASENSSDEHDFANIKGKNKLGLSAFQIARTSVNRQKIPSSGSCFAKVLNGSGIYGSLIGAFDLDRTGAVTRNITLVYSLSSYNNNRYGGIPGDYVGKNHSPSGTKWAKQIKVNGRTDLVLNPRDRVTLTASARKKFNKDNLTDICYGTACAPLNSIINPPGRRQAYLHMAVKMNALSNSSQNISVVIPSRREPGAINYDLIQSFRIERSSKDGENWSSIKCL